jgi:photosystem II stability/assembly factor-like uncharacterized protein
VLRPRNGWRAWKTWSLPLLAAGAVAAVVGAVVGIGAMRHSAAPPAPAMSHQGTPAPVQTVHSTPTPHNSRPVLPPQPDPNGVTGFRVMDLTFVGVNRGWAAGLANCVSGPGLCTALFRTTNGRTWTSMPGAQFNMPMPNDACADPCVEHIRFANAKVGYAFGPDALLMTTDGGRNWIRQPGGALAIETLNDNVIRVVAKHLGCPGPCDISVQTSAIGSTSWHAVALAGTPVSGITVALSRSGSDAYLLITQNPAGGASNETSTLYVSTDNGATWKPHGEPCPQAGGEVDSVAIAAAPPNTLTVLCAKRANGGRPQFVLLSKNAGATFQRMGHLAPGVSAILAGDPNTELVVAGAKAYLTADATAHWTRIRPLTDVSFLGFESASVGRAVTDGGGVVWSTYDGGKTWNPYEFR